MSRKIEIELEEGKAVFFLLEEVNAFLHQPDHYPGSEETREFAARLYPELGRVFYHVVWNWLPPETQKEIEDRPSPFEV